MKCRHCNHRFSAADAQPAPGGSGAPGQFLLFALALAGVTAALFLLVIRPWRWLAFGLTLFAALKMLIAWADGRRPAGLQTRGGGSCPACGHDNPVYPWSL